MLPNCKHPQCWSNTQPGSLIANKSMELLCIDFLKVDLSWDSKENVLVLPNPFLKFSQTFVTLNQKALTIANILMDKWFYVYSIPTWIHSDKSYSFENDILTQLYSMYGIKQSSTTPYNPCGNSICEWFNHTLLNLLKILPKEQKSDWPSHVPSLVFAYNATSALHCRISAVWAGVWPQGMNHLCCLAWAGQLWWWTLKKQKLLYKHTVWAHQEC